MAPPAAHAATALPWVTGVASLTAVARERPRCQAAPRVQEEMKALELATSCRDMMILHTNACHTIVRYHVCTSSSV